VDCPPPEQEPVIGIEALWYRTVAAQRGRYFLLKWMVVGGAAHGLGMVAQFAATRFLVPTTTSGWAAMVWTSISFSVLSSAAFGWVIFGMRWRTLAWAVVPLLIPLTMLMIGGGSLVSGNIALAGFNYVFSFVVIYAAELPLLFGIRQKPAWWLVANAVSFGLSFGVRFVADAINAVLAWQTPPPPWFSVYFLVNSLAGSLELAIQGATLAWLMPPVASAEPPRDSAITP
jgi:hypothetical protein